MPTRALETARLAPVAEARLDAVDGEESTMPNGGREQHPAAPRHHTHNGGNGHVRAGQQVDRRGHKDEGIRA
eukprot:scaffold5779_cov108-Isochrysis_galbana.AAC.6